MVINDNNRNNSVDQTPVAGIWANHKAIYTALIAVIILLSGAVVYLAMVRNTEQVNNQQTNNNTQTPNPNPTTTTPNPTSTSNETVNWKTYANKADCYSVKYNTPYRVWLGHNLVNYNGDDPEYEMGNPNGVKIQIQKHGLSGGQTFAGAMADINNNIAANGTMETRVEKYSLGNIQYANETLSGPGGAFDVFYAPSKDGKSYYAILVWNIENDKGTVDLILSTFTPETCPQ